MFFLLYGDDTFTSRKKLAAMRERFSATRDSTGLNAVQLRGKDATIEAVAEHLYASPFLAEKKLLVLDGFLRADTELQTVLAEMLPRKPESTNVIFFEDTGAKDLAKSPLLPLLAKQKFTEECVPLAPAQRERAVTAECAAAGVPLAPAAARALMAAVADDAWRLNEEVSKLVSYAKATGSPQITAEHVSLLVTSGAEESVFELVDACTDGRAGVAVVLLERMLAQGAAPLQLVAMLTKQYRTLLAAADLVEAGIGDKNELARLLGLHPFPAGKAMAAVRRPGVTPARLRDRFEALLQVERGIKTSAAAPEVLLGMWVAADAPAAARTASRA